MSATIEADRRRVHVEHCMGTVFTIDVRDESFRENQLWAQVVVEASRWLHHVDDVFSTYRHDSDISRINRGVLALPDAHPDVATVLARCAQLQRATGGYFSSLHDGVIDPTGLVKGWAVERVSQLLRSHGSRHHAVNGGGDVQLAGEASPGRPWRIGVVSPGEPHRVLTTVSGRNFAVATSGTSERGLHIRNPLTGRPATALRSATVVGPSLTDADCYATAAIAMGEDAPRWLESLPGHEGLLVRSDGSQYATAGFARDRDAAASLI
jgi:thiamine biosynthesis lipoprotein